MSQLTIDINDDAKKKLNLLAKKRKSTVANLIKELIIEETKKMSLQTSKKRLGTYLSELPLAKIPDYVNDKEMLGKLRQEKHLGKE
jgi:hypothetical protein